MDVMWIFKLMNLQFILKFGADYIQSKNLISKYVGIVNNKLHTVMNLEIYHIWKHERNRENKFWKQNI